MQKNANFLTTMGLCEKSGACLIGEAACLAGIRDGTARLLFMDESASENTQKRFRDACDFHKVQLVLFQARVCDLASAVGKPTCKLIVIKDLRWSRSLFEQYSHLNS